MADEKPVKLVTDAVKKRIKKLRADGQTERAKMLEKALKKNMK